MSNIYWETLSFNVGNIRSFNEFVKNFVEFTWQLSSPSLKYVNWYFHWQICRVPSKFIITLSVLKEFSFVLSYTKSGYWCIKMAQSRRQKKRFSNVTLDLKLRISWSKVQNCNIFRPVSERNVEVQACRCFQACIVRCQWVLGRVIKHGIHGNRLSATNEMRARTIPTP
jgi:hypothetical protein